MLTSLFSGYRLSAVYIFSTILKIYSSSGFLPQIIIIYFDTQTRVKREYTDEKSNV